MPTSRCPSTQTLNLASELLLGARSTSRQCVWPFNISGLHQGDCLGFRVSSQERDTSPVTSGELIGDHEAGSSPSASLGATSLAVSGPGNCHQLGEIRSQAFWHCSPSERRSFQQTLGLSDFGIWQTSFLSSLHLLQRSGRFF